MVSAVSKLRTFLEEGKDWERRKTSITGVFLIKVPATGSRPAELAVEINPVDSSGQTRTRRGLILRGLEDLEDFGRIHVDEKLSTLVKMLQQVNLAKNRTG